MAAKRTPSATSRTPEELARIKATRERFQSERPTLADLVASGECEPLVSQGAYRQLRSLMHELKAAREGQGLSLADVAARSGLDKASLSRLETGAHVNPTVETLWRYAAAVGREMDWLLSEAKPISTGTSESTSISSRTVSSDPGKRGGTKNGRGK